MRRLACKAMLIACAILIGAILAFWLVGYLTRAILIYLDQTLD